MFLVGGRRLRTVFLYHAFIFFFCLHVPPFCVLFDPLFNDGCHGACFNNMHTQLPLSATLRSEPNIPFNIDFAFSCGPTCANQQHRLSVCGQHNKLAHGPTQMRQSLKRNTQLTSLRKRSMNITTHTDTQAANQNPTQTAPKLRNGDKRRKSPLQRYCHAVLELGKCVAENAISSTTCQTFFRRIFHTLEKFHHHDDQQYINDRT